MQCFLCGVGMLSHPYKYSIGFPSELNLGSARRSRTSQETSERSGARQVRRKGGVSNTVIMTRVINFKLTHSAVQTAASGQYPTVGILPGRSFKGLFDFKTSQLGYACILTCCLKLQKSKLIHSRAPI